MRAELARLRPSALQRRARAAGVPQDELDAAADSGDPAAATVGLIVARALAGRHGSEAAPGAERQRQRLLPQQQRLLPQQQRLLPQRLRLLPQQQRLLPHQQLLLRQQPQTAVAGGFEPAAEGTFETE